MRQNPARDVMRHDFRRIVVHFGYTHRSNGFWQGLAQLAGLVAQRKTAHAISAAPASGATTRKIRSDQTAIKSIDDARPAA
jgi:hypothetical protein